MKISFGQLLCFITIFIRQLYGQEIIDFTYSAQHHSKSQNYVAESIQIYPNKRQITKFQFPEVCSIGKTMQGQLQIVSYQQKRLEIHYQRIKEQAIQLLKMSEKIKNMKKSIKKNTQVFFSRKSATIDISESQMIKFQRQQQNIKQLRGQIKRETEQIQLYIKSQMSQYHNPFQLSSLKYQKNALIIKIDYLEEIFAKLKSNDRSHFKFNYNSFKQKMQGLTAKEGQIFDLSKMGIKFNYTRESQLKQKKILLQQSISYKKLILQNKKNEQTIQKERKNKFKSQKQTDQIQRLMEILKEKEKQKKTSNTIILECQQLRKRIIRQINQSINYHNYSYSCTSGTVDISNQISKLSYQLKETQNQLTQLEKTKKQTSDQFFQYYQKYKQQIADINLNFQSLKIEQYSHSKTQIEIILNTAKQQLKDIEAKIQRSKPYQKKAFNKDQLYHKIQRIKKKKAIYCRDNELYREKSREFWKRLTLFQQIVRYNQDINDQYNNEIRQLSQLQAQFREKKKSIIQHLS